ncbi:MAG: UvrABC system protein A [Candidatus Woesebacteria bacterium GW2011_GWA2_40_7]|uniref:UvrABC system protein A n=1 Tax=Candidatus Woesebacteria bacterium GW2011_GWA2_40_7 TaxID=1618562 RepID=A0A0G0WDX4_9BACT|nr:MAG: UvrABC system protein A [Candidatus Woesebacteria bacterium GW2011_GWA2_40_7]
MHPHCPICGLEISSLSTDQITSQVFALIEEHAKLNKVARFLLLAPVVRDRKGEFNDLFDNLRSKGISTIRIDGFLKGLDENIILIKTNKHTVEGVIDKLSVSQKDLKNEIFRKNLISRIGQSVESALKLSDGLLILTNVLDKALEFPPNPKQFKDHLFSEKFSCPLDNISLPEIEPRTFSFNSPHGACKRCLGVGKILKIDQERVFAPELSIREGGILPFVSLFENDTWYSRLILIMCDKNNIDTGIPIKNIRKDKVKILLEGTGEIQYKVNGKNRFGKNTYIYEIFGGLENELTNKYVNSESEWVKKHIEKFMVNTTCPDCQGARLKDESLKITITGYSIAHVCDLSIVKVKEWVDNLIANALISSKEIEIANLIIKEVSLRLEFLLSVGLEYLTLSRPSATLSGGEAQRIRLASQIGSGLSGVLYVLDEPTIGLHPKDNQKLIDTLQKLKDLGNTVIVVEHDMEMMRQSDWIVDVGPEAGKFGGCVIAQGTLIQIENNKFSKTGKYLSGKKKIEKISLNKNTISDVLTLSGCTTYNLQNIEVTFPLGKMVVITGVSGSGKSSLLVETLYPALYKKINRNSNIEQGKFKEIKGYEAVNKLVLIDQSPIGRTPRSNPATYTKLFDLIRDVYANTKEAKLNGFKKGRFSFNVKGGRCEECEGQGQIKIEMQFMSDIWVTCEVCHGKRYNAQTLEILYRGKNIAEVLDMTITDALEFFHAHPQIEQKLETLVMVGLGYMQLGQPATTLSGGEAQRVKLATELSKRSTGKTVYILDEPTTGLHFADVEKLMRVLKLLVQKGNSVFVIEHNLDVIKNSDYIIDLGPEGGEGGGKIVAKGSVKDIKSSKSSYTAEYL